MTTTENDEFWDPIDREARTAAIGAVIMYVMLVGATGFLVWAAALNWGSL